MVFLNVSFLHKNFSTSNKNFVSLPVPQFNDQDLFSSHFIDGGDDGSDKAAAAAAGAAAVAALVAVDRNRKYSQPSRDPFSSWAFSYLSWTILSKKYRLVIYVLVHGSFHLPTWPRRESMTPTCLLIHLTMILERMTLILEVYFRPRRKSLSRPTPDPFQQGKLNIGYPSSCKKCHSKTLFDI